ncbi:MAG: hypothetical protein NTW21_08905 [Verrucomicrobia bacterium]|nr:hypothetical protein [Verrucomicrobiota bacterium]
MSTPVRTNRKAACRARSLRHPGAYVSAVYCAALHYLSLVALLTCAVVFFIRPHPGVSHVLLLSLLACGLTWLVSFMMRRSAICPLCKGTPLLNSGARTHAKAFHIRPFNHGVTAVLSIISTQQFRCMYCGSNFDLRKAPGHLRCQYRKEAFESYSDPKPGAKLT